MLKGNHVTVRALVVFFWALLIATAAAAGPEHMTEIKIAIEGDDAAHRVIRLDGVNADFDFRELEVGESKVIKDDNGNDVTVSRTENGYEFDVEGEKIEIAGLHGEHEITMLHEAHDDKNAVIRKHKQVRMIKTEDAHGVTIISGDEIDEETRAELERVLKEAGKDGEILFLDGSELSGDEQAHGKHEVHIIKKEINVTN